jgi:hypothetical protein
MKLWNRRVTKALIGMKIYQWFHRVIRLLDDSKLVVVFQALLRQLWICKVSYNNCSNLPLLNVVQLYQQLYLTI